MRQTNMIVRRLSLGAGLVVLSAAAAAQSNVTLYGVMDTYLGHTNAGGKGSMTDQQSGGWAASRWGLRGSEDLGGGLRAVFTLENGILTNSGGFADSTRVFNRQSYLGLAGGWGEVRLGRQNSPAFWMLGSMDAFNGATYGSLLNNVSGYTPRFDNVIYYVSPEFSGLKVQGGHALGNQPAGQPRSGLAATMLGVEYKSGPFWVGMNHSQQNSANTSVKAKATFLGGNWDWGSGKVYLGLHRGNMNGAALATNVAGRDYDAWSLSADWRITPAITLGALYGRANDKTAFNGDAKQASLLATYTFSKRTMVYSTITRLENSGGATFSLGAAGPITRNVPAAGQDVSGFQVGIRHQF
jgi:predicted porin